MIFNPSVYLINFSYPHISLELPLFIIFSNRSYSSSSSVFFRPELKICNFLWSLFDIWVKYLTCGSKKKIFLVAYHNFEDLKHKIE